MNPVYNLRGGFVIRRACRMDQVNFLRRLRKLGKNPEEQEMPYSIVLLLREPHFFTEVELLAAGERGWDKCFDGKADPMYFVVQKETVTMLKAGGHVVQLLHAAALSR
jgi:hypothetical protein